MKESHLIAFFAAFVSLAFISTWYYVSHSSLQVMGAIEGIPGTEPMSATMAVTLLVSLFMFAAVLFLRRPHH